MFSLHLPYGLSQQAFRNAWLKSTGVSQCSSHPHAVSQITHALMKSTTCKLSQLLVSSVSHCRLSQQAKSTTHLLRSSQHPPLIAKDLFALLVAPYPALSTAIRSTIPPGLVLLCIAPYPCLCTGPRCTIPPNWYMFTSHHTSHYALLTHSTLPSASYKPYCCLTTSRNQTQESTFLVQMVRRFEHLSLISQCS